MAAHLFRSLAGCRAKCSTLILIHTLKCMSFRAQNPVEPTGSRYRT
jgi:hypothetical protein